MSERERARERAWKRLQEARQLFADGRSQEYELQRAERAYERAESRPSAGGKRGTK